MNTKILILCTGNSCRSQMAEGILRSCDSSLHIRSAGTRPEKVVNPYAIKVMEELGISLSGHYPKNITEFLDEDWDYVITVCDNAKVACPFFPGKVKHRLHIGFEDPADATGTPEQIIAVYRRIRDEINKGFHEFYINTFKS
jgi:arsenate reductase (thioredoxin)